MEAITAVFIIALHITVLGMSGTALPPDVKHQRAFATEAACKQYLRAKSKEIRASLPVSPNSIECLKLEVSK